MSGSTGMAFARYAEDSNRQFALWAKGRRQGASVYVLDEAEPALAADARKDARG
jgi:hypothetical protein